MAGVRDYYLSTVAPKMMEEFNYKNRFQVPRFEKMVLNMGLGEGGRDRAIIDEAVSQMATICGQRPILTLVRKSIAAFKVRAGMPVGCKATLRGRRMFEFFERLVNVAVPQIRDFRGLPDTLDGRGNYNIGMDEIIVFPEVNPDKIKRSFGMHISIVTTAKTDAEGRRLLELLGFPFKRR
ncbi:50S ribosomal protein L5 [bacterium]|nr:50S ribosomal protein L5 [bacterium]